MRYNELMSPILEKVFHDVEELPKADQLDLYRLLRERLETNADEEIESDTAVEEAWDEEIAGRIKEIEEGKVALISGEEADRRTDALLSRLGLSRSPRTS